MESINSLPLTSTSAAGQLAPRSQPELLGAIGGWIIVPGTSANPDFEWGGLLAEVRQTTSGLQYPNQAQAPQGALMELRRISGLTWEQLGELFGVSRRTIHFWASGKTLTFGHEQLLQRALGIVKDVDRGSATLNRPLFLSPLRSGVTGLELLADGRFAEFVDQVGRGSGRQHFVLPALSKSSREDRRPLSVAQLLAGGAESIELPQRRVLRVTKIKIKKKKRSRKKTV